jgi:hypothetical protein
MGRFWVELKNAWADMLESPWRHTGPDDLRRAHWVNWLVGWAWAVAGLVLGALVAPKLIEVAGLKNIPHQDWLIVAVAIIAGFSVHLFGWALTLPPLVIAKMLFDVWLGVFILSVTDDLPENKRLSKMFGVVVVLGLIVVALAASVPGRWKLPLFQLSRHRRSGSDNSPCRRSVVQDIGISPH